MDWPERLILNQIPLFDGTQKKPAQRCGLLGEKRTDRAGLEFHN